MPKKGYKPGTKGSQKYSRANYKKQMAQLQAENKSLLASMKGKNSTQKKTIQKQIDKNNKLIKKMFNTEKKSFKKQQKNIRDTNLAREQTKRLMATELTAGGVSASDDLIAPITQSTVSSGRDYTGTEDTKKEGMTLEDLINSQGGDFS